LGSLWRLLDLGDLSPLTTQVVYHAVALAVDQNMSPSTIILCSPNNPLVCVGYHQEIEMEVHTEYCSLKGLPVVRRILGGGAVYLDEDQLFYQVIAKKSDPEVPESIQELFRKFLVAPTKTYNDIGIPARYRSVNDIEVEGRKISGSGATDIGSVSVLTGNIIFDFNFEEMTRILKVPSEKFRDKVAKTLRERLTTIKNELPNPPSREHVRELLRRNYEASLHSTLIEGELSQAESEIVESLEKKYMSLDWLNSVGNEHRDLISKRNLKISGRAFVGGSVYKTTGGLLRVLVETFDDRIVDIMITGDFSFIPRERLKLLESALRDAEVVEQSLADRICRFYMDNDVESPGMTPEDVARAVVSAISKRS
jgi:lipoate-protein ligase A